jgi:hypothetical protein
MRKALTVITLLAGAMSVHSQAENLSLSDDRGIQILDGQGSAPANGTAYTVTYGGYTSGTEYYGSGSNPNLGYPGSTVWAAGSALGTGYSLELLEAPGITVDLDSLVPVGPVISTWQTAAGGNPNAGLNGFWNSSALVDGLGFMATVAIAAWNNEGGSVNTLAAAQAAGDPWGISQMEHLELDGKPFTTGLFVSDKIESFSLGANTVPEPGTIALEALGASTFLFRRRK